MKSSNIVCIGELLIDFICTDIGTDLVQGNMFVKRAGGAPANVAAAISRLGGFASIAGKVGGDPFGEFLEKCLNDAGVDTSMVIKDSMIPTTLAFVSLKENGERDFVFNRGADRYLSANDINLNKLRQAKIIHFGSATALLDNPFQSLYLDTMKQMKDVGRFISFDPNYRQDLWKGRINDFVALSRLCMEHADFVKVSEEELQIIAGTDDKEKALRILHSIGVGVVTVTLGKQGTLLSNINERSIIKSIDIKSVDSTGAGDAFVGSMLFQLAQHKELAKISLKFDFLSNMVSFSNKVGALTCTKVGAIASMPTYEEVNVQL